MDVLEMSITLYKNVADEIISKWQRGIAISENLKAMLAVSYQQILLSAAESGKEADMREIHDVRELGILMLALS